VVYGVDADGDFPYLRLLDYAKARGRTPEFDSLQAELGLEIFGAGHLGWLRHDFGSAPAPRLRELGEFTE
jgi:hypothetical protein